MTTRAKRGYFLGFSPFLFTKRILKMSTAKEHIADTTVTLIELQYIKENIARMEKKLELAECKIEKKLLDIAVDMEKNNTNLRGYMAQLDSRLWQISMIVMSSVVGYVMSKILHLL